MAQVHVIRHKVLVEGLSIRRVAREMGVSRNTVSKYLKQPQPVRREGPRRKPVLERVLHSTHISLEQQGGRRAAGGEEPFDGEGGCPSQTLPPLHREWRRLRLSRCPPSARWRRERSRQHARESE